MKLVGIAMVFLTSFSLFGGIYMEDQVKNEKGAIVKQSKTWIESDKLRVDVDTPTEHHTMIYLVNVPQILIINRGAKTYFEMGSKEIAMTKQMFQMQKQRMEKMKIVNSNMRKKQCDELKKQQKEMPKKKRAEMNNAVAAVCGNMVVTTSSDVSWQKNGKGTIGKWKCMKWIGKLGKKKVAESCTITTKSVGIQTADFNVFKLIEKNFSMMNPEEKDSFVSDLKMRGIPVQSTTFEAGVAVENTIVKEIKKESFPASIFQLPKGLKQQKNPAKQVVPHDK